jgi:hypothetical protein
VGKSEKIFGASTTTRKLQLRQELNNIRQRDMSVADYTAKIKEICDALGSIDMIVEDDKMFQICLGGLAQRFGLLRTAICTREKPPSFFDLQSMLLVEENHGKVTKNAPDDGQMLYTQSSGGRGRGRGQARGWRGRGNRSRNMQRISDVQGWRESNQGSSTRMGSHMGTTRRQNGLTTCWYCGRKGHCEEDYWKKANDSTNQQRSNYTNNAGQEEKELVLFMKHCANSMEASTSKLKEVWYVDSGTCNHMTNHEDWFTNLHEPKQPGNMETGDDTTH